MAEFDLRRWRCVGQVPVTEDVPTGGGGANMVWLRRRACLAERTGNEWRLLGGDQTAARLAGIEAGEAGLVADREPCGVFVSDDGALADHQLLGPLCRDKRVPFVLGIVKDYVGRRHGVGYMDLVRLHEMAEMGCELVGHTVSHPSLAVLGRRAIEREVGESLKWLRDQGWPARHFVYPFGAHRVAAERVLDGMCDSACIVTGGVARPPFLRTRVPRHAMGSFFHGGISTFDGYRALVDEAVRERRMLVWMLHPWSEQHDANQQAILRDLIDYMRDTGMRITNLSDAWEIHGNLWETQVGFGGEMVLDRDGCLWRAGSCLPVGSGLASRMVDSRVFGVAMKTLRTVRAAMKG